MFKYFCFILIFIFSCKESSEDYFEKIEKLRSQSKYKQAIKLLKEGLVSLDIDNDLKNKSLLKIGDLYKDLDQNKISAKYYEAYLKKEKPESDEKYYDILITIGDKYFSLNKYGFSERYYKEALKVSFSLNQKAVVFLKLGNTFLKQKNFKIAIFYYDKAIKASSKNVLLNQKALFLKAIFFHFFETKEQDENSINLLKQCVNKNKNSYYGTLCSFYLVDFLKKEGQKKKAEELLERLEGSFLNESLIEIKKKKALNN